MINLGQRIAAWRHHRGMTQKQLAEELGVVPSAVAMWETGDSTPTTKNLDALARHLAGDHVAFYSFVPEAKAS